MRGFRKGCHSWFYTEDFGFVQLNTKGRGHHSVFLLRCPGTHSLWVTKYSRHSRGGVGWSANDWCINLLYTPQPSKRLNCPETQATPLYFFYKHFSTIQWTRTRFLSVGNGAWDLMWLACLWITSMGVSCLYLCILYITVCSHLLGF